VTQNRPRAKNENAVTIARTAAMAHAAANPAATEHAVASPAAAGHAALGSAATEHAAPPRNAKSV